MWTINTQDRPSVHAASHRVALLYLIIFAISVAPFVLTITRGFFMTDDFPLLYLARTFSITDLFTPGFYHRYANFGFIRPVGLMVWKLDYLLFGRNPAGYHLTVVAINAACTLLTFRLAMALTKNTAASFISAVLFAVSPCRVEPANWVAGGYEPIACMFYLASILLYDRSREKGAWVYYAGAFALGLAAVFSKETAITLPLAILVYESFTAKTGGRLKRSIRALPFFSLAVLVIALRLAVFHSLGGYKGAGEGSAHSQVPSIGELGARLLIYIKTLVYGFDPSFFYQGYFAPAIIALLVAGMIFSKAVSGRRRAAALALALSLVAVLPILNFSIIEENYMASSRYLYLPSAFFSIFIGCLFTPPAGAKKWARAVQVACGVALVTLQLAATIDREHLFLMFFDRSRDVLTSFEKDVRPGTLDGLEIEMYNMPNSLFGYDEHEEPNFSYALQYLYGYPGRTKTKLMVRNIGAGETLGLSSTRLPGYSRKVVFIYYPMTDKIEKVLDSDADPLKEMSVMIK